MKASFLFLSLLLLLWSDSAFCQHDQICRVERMVMCCGVDQKEPQGEAREFDAATGRVVCWMRIACVEIPQEVQHIWYVDGQKQAEVPLTVKFPTMRTWSSKNIWPGQWKVQAVDEAGGVLTETSFVVR